ncbi:MAG: acyl-CoA thioesterase [Microbacteriaceae bacterium]|nr:acyl-CoA thioesterase [Microbacteriaceae bacterium]
MTKRLLRALALVATGVVLAVLLQRRRLRWITVLTNRIPAHHTHWQQRGRVDEGSVLYVALGDSAALGIGASRPERGYVGLLADEIGRATGRRVRVRNLAIDGATLAVCIRDELHRLAPLDPVVCTIDIGANDIWTFDPDRFRAEFETICAALPAGAIVAELPSFSVVPVARRVRAANRIVHDVAEAHGFWVAPLHATTALGGLSDALLGAAGDLFHPNDRGHRRWAEAFRPGVLAALRRAGLTG